jgi:hypothetical protein
MQFADKFACGHLVQSVVFRILLLVAGLQRHETRLFALPLARLVGQDVESPFVEIEDVALMILPLSPR